MNSQEYIRRDEFIKILQEYIQELRIDLKGPTGNQGPAVHLISESYELSSQGNPPGLRIDQ